jgi:hypothetical protein
MQPALIPAELPHRQTLHDLRDRHPVQLRLREPAIPAPVPHHNAVNSAAATRGHERIVTRHAPDTPPATPTQSQQNFVNEMATKNS